MSRQVVRRSVSIGGLAVILLVVWAGFSPVYSAGGIDPGYAPGEIVVKLRPGFVASDADSVAARAGAAVKRPLPVEGWYHLVARDSETTVVEMRDALQSDARVAIAEPNYRCMPAATPNDPFYSQQWNMRFINMPAAWEPAFIRDASNIRVAVVDTAMRTDHPDLQGRFVSPVDVADDDTDPNPPTEARVWSEHGTMLSGIIGAVTNNGIGVAGICWGGVQIIPVKTWKDSNLTNIGDGTDYVDGLEAARIREADVVNMSIQFSVSFDLLREKIQEMANAGVILVAAAGNGGQGVSYPASYPETICVTSVDSNGDIVASSNRGPEVDLAAPGENITSTGLDSTTIPTSYYITSSGTSFAAPHVAGAAAVLLANGRDPSAVRGALEATAQQRGTGLPNSFYGYGILDVAAALLHQPFNVVIDRPQSGDILSTRYPPVRISLRGVALASVQVTVDSETAIASGAVANAKVSNYTAPTTSGQMAFSWPFDKGAHRITVTANAVYSASVTKTATTTFQVASRLLPAGKYLFSLPFTPLSSQLGLGDVVAAADGSTLLVYRQARWDPLTTAYKLYNYPGILNDMGASLQPADVRAGEGELPASGVSTTTMPRGVGYWLDLRQDAALFSPSYVDDSRSYAIELKRGWNQIGNPFPFPVGWGSALVRYVNETVSITDAVARGWISSALFRYEGGAYRSDAAPNGLLEPWKGYWVLVKVPPAGESPADPEAQTAKVTLYIPPLQGAPGGQPAVSPSAAARTSEVSSTGAAGSGRASAGGTY